VFPGEPGASHLHAFLGNTSTDADSTYDEMVAASTTCSMSSDTAGYWVPAVLVNDTAVDPIKMNAYYSEGQGVSPSDVVAFPADLRVVAGGDTLSSAKPKAASWSCQGGKTGPMPTDCGKKKVRAHVKFPNCWDGVATDSADHRAHMTYSTKSGGCPSTHPIAVPAVSIVLVYPITDGRTISLSSGSASTLHGDFWNTWDQAALESFTSTCIGGSGCGILRDA
jgi:hypothetical protein